MKCLVTILMILVLAAPVQAATKERFSRWSEAKCQTYHDHKSSYVRRILDHCITRLSKEKYEDYLTLYMKAVKNPNENQKKVMMKAGRALKRDDIKWISKKKQDGLDALKITGMAVGSIALIMGFAGLVIGAIAG